MITEERVHEKPPYVHSIPQTRCLGSHTAAELDCRDASVVPPAPFRSRQLVPRFPSFPGLAHEPAPLWHDADSAFRSKTAQMHTNVLIGHSCACHSRAKKLVFAQILHKSV